MLIVFDGLIMLYNVLMSQLEKEADFAHKLCLVIFIGELPLVQGLQSYQFADQLVHSEVDFAKGTTTQHLTDPVEANIRDGRFSCRREIRPNLLHH